MNFVEQALKERREELKLLKLKREAMALIEKLGDIEASFECYPLLTKNDNEIKFVVKYDDMENNTHKYLKVLHTNFPANQKTHEDFLERIKKIYSIVCNNAWMRG